MLEYDRAGHQLFTLGGNLFKLLGAIQTMQEKGVRTWHDNPRPKRSLLIDVFADSQLLATLGAATANDSLTPTVFHAGAEAMLVGALTIMWLEGSLHDLTYSLKFQMSQQI